MDNIFFLKKGNITIEVVQTKDVKIKYNKKYLQEPRSLSSYISSSLFGLGVGAMFLGRFTGNFGNSSTFPFQ